MDSVTDAGVIEMDPFITFILRDCVRVCHISPPRRKRKLRLGSLDLVLVL